MLTPKIFSFKKYTTSRSTGYIINKNGEYFIHHFEQRPADTEGYFEMKPEKIPVSVWKEWLKELPAWQ